MTGGAHDTLRDELAEAAYGPIKSWHKDTAWEAADDVGTALLPVVRRYADAQVAAERDRAKHCGCAWCCSYLAPGVQRGEAHHMCRGARIARGQP